MKFDNEEVSIVFDEQENSLQIKLLSNTNKFKPNEIVALLQHYQRSEEIEGGSEAAFTIKSEENVIRVNGNIEVAINGFYEYKIIDKSLESKMLKYIKEDKIQRDKQPFESKLTLFGGNKDTIEENFTTVICSLNL